MVLLHVLDIVTVVLLPSAEAKLEVSEWDGAVL